MKWNINMSKPYANPLQHSCLENPKDGGACKAAIYGVTQSWTRLKWLSSSSSTSSFNMGERELRVYYNWHTSDWVNEWMVLLFIVKGNTSGIERLKRHFWEALDHFRTKHEPRVSKAVCVFWCHCLTMGHFSNLRNLTSILTMDRICSCQVFFWEGGSGWGTHVHLWLIHVSGWQNQYSIVKQNKVKIKIQKMKWIKIKWMFPNTTDPFPDLILLDYWWWFAFSLRFLPWITMTPHFSTCLPPF